MEIHPASEASHGRFEAVGENHSPENNTPGTGFRAPVFFFGGGGVPNHITTAPKNVLVLAFPSFLLGGGGVI